MYNAAKPFSSNRLFEWTAALTMLLCGLIILADSALLSSAPQAAFAPLLSIGLTATTVGFCFIGIGLLRGIALFANGSWFYGPHIRVICAAVGMAVWCELIYGLLLVLMYKHDVFLSAAAWISLTVGEYYSIQRAILDVRAKPMKPILHPSEIPVPARAPVKDHTS